MVLHDLRRLRRAVPGGHRARRPHRRHAPLPGADRVGVPERAGRAVQEPGEQPEPVGHDAAGPAGLGQGPAVRGQAGRHGRRGPRRRSSTCSGSAARALTRTAQKKTTRASPSCCTPPASTSPSSATASPAPATRPAAPATSSCSRCWPMQNVETLNEVEREEDRGHLRALLQHAVQRVPAAGRQLRGRPPHPAAEPAGPRQAAGAGGRRRPRPQDGVTAAAHASPTTTPATWAGTTASTSRRAS